MMSLNNIKKMKIGGKTKMKIKYGAEWYRQVLFDNWVQQRLSRSRYKILNNQVSDNTLDGLVIDWHLAEYDYPAIPIGDSQPTYAYA